VTAFDCSTAYPTRTSDLTDSLTLAAISSTTYTYNIENSISSTYTGCDLFCVEITPAAELANYITLDNTVSPATLTFSLANVVQAHIGVTSLDIAIKTSDCVTEVFD
jgi:hypothetical protein